MLLSCLGGCMTTDSQKKQTTSAGFNVPHKGMEVPNVQGPDGSPVMVTRGSQDDTVKMANYVQAKKTGKLTKPTKGDSGVVQASANTTTADPGVVQASGFARIIGTPAAGCADGSCGVKHAGWGQGQGIDPSAYGPMGSQFDILKGNAGIMPVPAMGVPGAVAAIGAIGPGSPYGPTISNQRTSIKFVSPERVRVSWLSNGVYADTGLVAPASYNFMQGNVYRLKLAGVPTQPSKLYYPTLEIAPATLKTVTFLSHNSVPVAFTNDDFDRVNAGNMVIKVIYLPDPAFQDAAALGGAEEVVSTQLEPGADPIVEATRRGAILAVVRLGNINLENPNSPAMDAVTPGGMAPPAGMMPPPGMMAPPPGMMPPAMPQAMSNPSTAPTAPTMPVSIPQVR
ncbi:hypothetical protein PX52LOC_00832 [Limnoglobus roseus]|uniref:Uncharacterized protein n=2 Tax=Limnoglobus roseus TaxID=2598579 RepID=A0A5C1A875_9BACT|nr:hypothetical protein PX52LOC_00832 [Limnoglobus roseus]